MKLFCVLLVVVHYGSKYSLASPILADQETSNTIDEVSLQFRESYAKRMRSLMNFSVNPCDDFYEYACGNYPNVIEDIELTAKQSVVYDVYHSLDGIIDEILSKERQPSEKYYEELQKVKRYVEVCDNADILPLKPSEEYLDILKKIGGFPAVDPTWNASTFDWFNMTAHLLRYGVVGFVKEEVFFRDPFPPLFEIGNLGFGFDAYSDNIRTNDSLGYVHNMEMMKRLLQTYGVTGLKADKVMEEIIAFWKEVLDFQSTAKQGCGEFGEDNKNITKFPKWNSLFVHGWESNDTSFFQMFTCPCDFYFNKLDEISKRRPEALANYMALKFLFMMHPRVKSSKFQHQYCLTQARETFPLVLSHFYIQEHFSKKDHNEIQEMMSELIKAFINMVQSTDWLDEQTRFGVLDTLKILNFTIGHIEDPVTNIYINETNKLKLTDKHALNNIELAKFRVDISRYGFLNSEKVNSEALTSTPPYELMKAIGVNAFYDNLHHVVNVLAGILLPPVYHKDLPKSAKYGGLGFIVGHEIVHSLDPKGRQGETHYKEIHEWSAKSRQAMKINSECFIQHQSNVTVPQLKLKLEGKESLTETVCDSGGLRGALNAYRSVFKEAVKDNNQNFKDMETLPGMSLSPDQTLILNFAQVYCAKYEPRHYWSERYKGYPMNKYRVNLPLQNFDEFSRVFECPLGSPMNPAVKCRMW